MVKKALRVPNEKASKSVLFINRFSHRHSGCMYSLPVVENHSTGCIRTALNNGKVERNRLRIIMRLHRKRGTWPKVH